MPVLVILKLENQVSVCQHANAQRYLKECSTLVEVNGHFGSCRNMVLEARSIGRDRCPSSNLLTLTLTNPNPSLVLSSARTSTIP